MDEEVGVELVSVGRERRGRWWLAGRWRGGMGEVEGRGEGSDRANSLGWLQAQGTTDSWSWDCEGQVIGNVWFDHHGRVSGIPNRWMVSLGDLQTHSFSSARFA